MRYTQTTEPPYTEPYVRWCERTTVQLMNGLLLDSYHAGIKTLFRKIVEIKKAPIESAIRTSLGTLPATVSSFTGTCRVRILYHIKGNNASKN